MVDYAIDPGPHTGIFYMTGPLGRHVPHRVTLDYTDGLVRYPLQHLYIWCMQMVDPDKDRIILESFEYRKEDAKEREYIDYSTGEFVGVVKLYCNMTGCKLTVQQAAQAKSGFWNDHQLKKVGLYVAGEERRHERDATRHWLYDKTFGEGRTVDEELFWFGKLRQT